LLARCTGKDDIVVGSPITGRNHADTEHIIGMFVNMLALRNPVPADISFYDFLQDVKKNTLDAFENENFQFDELVRKLDLQGEAGSDRLLETVFNMLNVTPGDGQPDTSSEEFGESEGPGYTADSGGTLFTLLLAAREIGDTVGMLLRFSNATFKRDTIQKMARDYIDILKQVTAEPNAQLGDVKISHQLLTTKATALRAKTKDKKSAFHF
ncbi:MAG: hypothetical protein GY757_60720, partial [bacterium]|nr:hypothetical protein [bacterium]